MTKTNMFDWSGPPIPFSFLHHSTVTSITPSDFHTCVIPEPFLFRHNFLYLLIRLSSHCGFDAGNSAATVLILSLWNLTKGAIVDGHNEGRGKDGPVRAPPLRRREGHFLINSSVVFRLDCLEHWGNGERLGVSFVSFRVRRR